MRARSQADIRRQIAVWQILRGHPHPGQRYRHGWVPVAGAVVAEAADTKPRSRPGRLGDLSTDELLDRFYQESGKAKPSTTKLHAIYRELDRREQETAVQRDAPQRQRLEELLGKGVDYRTAYAEAYDLSLEDLDREERAALVDQSRRKGETREQTVRRLYAELVDLSYLQAEQATRGNVLSAAGTSAGIDPRSLFSGPRARARKYASEELKRWWEDHPRQTYTEFRAAMLARNSDKKRIRASASAGNGRDFGL